VRWENILKIIQMDKLVISFSSGESSAFMAQWCKRNLANKYDMLFVMANTSEENEASLIFAEKCNKLFGLDLVYVEAITNPQHGIGVSARVTTFDDLYRKGEVFEAYIAKHGIPNQTNPSCTREMKAQTIKAYCRQIGWKDYYTAIGYRIDEDERASDKAIEQKMIYPLIDLIPMTKVDVNLFWRDMPFRVELKGYEDNCKVCWKKSLRKLLTIAKHHPERFENFRKWEKKYQDFTPATREEKAKPPYRFYRGNLTVDEILEMAKQPFEEAPDERDKYIEYKQLTLDFNGQTHFLDFGGGRCGKEACEAFSNNF
jgi:hypothetical protein